MPTPFYLKYWGYNQMKKENKNNKENSEIISNRNIKKNQNKIILGAIILMILIIAIITLIPIIKIQMSKFTYISLTFQKTQLGKITFYSSYIPVVDSSGKIISSYAINLRTDPRSLENINSNITNNTIKFIKTRPVYLSLDPEMKVCELNSIAMVTLAGFLRDSGLDVKSAVTDNNYSTDNNLQYKTCETSPENTVILVNSGNATEVKEIKKNCYEITYKDCEIMPASEKFIITILKEYMSHFKKIK
jgi:hypothetical protein